MFQIGPNRPHRFLFAMCPAGRFIYRRIQLLYYAIVRIAWDRCEHLLLRAWCVMLATNIREYAIAYVCRIRLKKN